MAGAPRVTLLVIAYRMAATIDQALRSAFAQTYPCEIVVSDDSSGDDTVAIARAIAEDYAGPHRVRVRSTARNLGLCAHLDELAKEAAGDILVFLAGDDVAYPERVEKLVAAFAAHSDAQVVGSAVDEIDPDGNTIRRAVRALPERVEQRWLLTCGKMTTVLGASMAVRRSLIADLPPLEGAIEDNMLTLRAALVGECRCLPEALLGYRRHADNFAKRVFVRDARDFDSFERRNRKVIALYRDIAADQRRCIAARPDLPEERRALGRKLAEMYELEADMREAILDRPRLAWLPLLARGLVHPGLRRRSIERTLKLVVPRRVRLRR
ncbi:MAG TPA: glycosyltransferase [Rhodanobacteraceae bacterium]|nr:glycosyltransferase [Rhodanobacteraceae bacterium]